MPWSTTGKVLFFLYCLEFGLFLVIAPWSPSWDRAIMHLPAAWLRDLYLDPWVRGAFSGLGIGHLVLAAHDLNRFLARRFGSKAAPGVPHPFLTQLLRGGARGSGNGSNPRRSQP